MNTLRPVLVLACIAVIGISFNSSNQETASSQNLLQLPEKDYSPTNRYGKAIEAATLPEVYSTTNWFDLGFPKISEETTLALRHHKHILKSRKYRDVHKVGNLSVTADDFSAVIDLLIEREGVRPDDLHQYIDAHQVWGEKKKGNVLFTGYYTPVVKARKKKSGKYKFPIYANPESWTGPMPSRREIEKEGALAGLGLELAYADNPIDIAIMQLQGSGYIDFVDSDERRLFRFAGHNGHRYRNIQHFFRQHEDIKIGDVSFNGIKRFLQKNPSLTDSVLHFNPAYTFFDSQKGLVKGAGQVPLMQTISVAADPKYFPAGSVLLAAMPVTKKGKVTHHEYRILLPQDVGSAVKGTGHIDVYCGVGTAGQKMASNLHHYGKVWLLTPKQDPQIASL
ncbi:MAG: MltA domain-containing protein [Bacteroidota bacterium]